MYGRRTTQVASCKHVFCTTCLDEWTYEHPTCPLCRQPAPPRTSPRHAVIEVTDKGVLYYWRRSSDGTPRATKWGLPPQRMTSTGRAHIVLHRGDTWYRYAYNMLVKDPVWWGDWAQHAVANVSAHDIRQLATDAEGETDASDINMLFADPEVVSIIAEELYGASVAPPTTTVLDGATPATPATPVAAELVIPLPSPTA